MLAQAKAKTVKAKPIQAAQPLGPSNAVNLHAGKALEEIYQKKSQLEHILLRPDTYIGSTEKQQQQTWVHDGTKMVLQNISYVPGLYKIFDEILVNAADNKVCQSSSTGLNEVHAPHGSMWHHPSARSEIRRWTRSRSTSMWYVQLIV